MAHDKTKNENDEGEAPQNTNVTSVPEMPASEEKKEICRNFQRNRCNKGDSCKYLHVPKTERSSRSRSRDRERRGGSRSRGGIRRDRSRSPMPCRDYERGLCNRGKNCRYFHPDDGREIRQKTIEVCRKFLKDECERTDCRFLHVTQSDEDLFVSTGQVSNGIIDQAVRLALDSSISVGTGKPACRRFIYEHCREPCKFSHIPLNELERLLCMSIVTEFEKEFGSPQRNIGGIGSLMGNNIGGMNSQLDIGLGFSGGNQMGGPNFNNAGMGPGLGGGPFGGRWGNEGGNMGGSEEMQMLMNDNRRNMDTIQQLQREIKDMEGKLMQYQTMEDEARKAQSLLQTAQMEKTTMKDALTRAEEFSNYFKNQVQVLTDEMKSLDSSKMELGILARRVLNDLPAIEAKLVPAWSSGGSSQEVQHWQGIAQNLRSLIQSILGLDVNSLGAGNQQQSGGVGSMNSVGGGTGGKSRDSYGHGHGGSDNRGDRGSRGGGRNKDKSDGYSSYSSGAGGDSRYNSYSHGNENQNSDQYSSGWSSQYGSGSQERGTSGYQGGGGYGGYGSTGWK